MSLATAAARKKKPFKKIPFKTEKKPEINRESEIGNRVAIASKLTFSEDKRLNKIDYTLREKGIIKANLEIRTKSSDHDRYPFYHFNYDRWMFMRSEWKRTGIIQVLAIDFTDGIYLIQVADQNYKITSLRDDQNYEINISTKDLRKLP